MADLFNQLLGGAKSAASSLPADADGEAPFSRIPPSPIRIAIA